MDVHTGASGWWLLIIVPEKKKNVFLKLTKKKKNFCCSCRYRNDFMCFQAVTREVLGNLFLNPD